MTNSMAVIPCKTCGGANGRYDRYCGSCGAALAELRWRSSGERFSDGEGHLVVRSSVATSAVARLANRGVGDAAVVLTDAGRAELPAWIDAKRLPRDAFIVPAGGEATVEVGLNTAALQAMFGQRSAESRRTDTADAQLHFRTTLTERSEASISSAGLSLRVLIARDPWITPAGSHYPFLSWEHLRSTGVAHTIEFHNEAAEPIRLFKLEVVNNALALGNREERIEAASVLTVAPLNGEVIIPPGEVHEVALRLASEGPAADGPSAVWFSASVKFHYTTGGDGNDRPSVASALIDGVIGKAPRLVFDGGETSSNRALSAPPDKPFDVVLTNPGSIPVAVQAVEILQEGADGLVVTTQDWLTVQGAAKDIILPAGGTITLTLAVRPNERSEEELSREICTRVIRLRHDGWVPEGEGVAELKVEVKFPSTLVDESVWLGVDFGTSSSMVCVLRGREATALILEPELGAEQLASLMYYDDARKKGSSEVFLLGAAARGSAALKPANLVRGIKSIVARAPGTIFHFEPANPGDSFRKFTTQQLLDHFIAALRTRGEANLRRLPVKQRQQIFQTSQDVRFRQAVFTHPVDVSDPMKEALHVAARHARLNGGSADAASFIKNSCVDEATAAVLAYVFLRAYEKMTRTFPVLDCERVVCFDVGGGTTDVAAVEIAGLNAFMAGNADNVVVTLHATAGDNRYGGDDFDRFLASDLLRQVFKSAEGAAAVAALRDYEDALDAGSLADFKNDFQAPAGAPPDTAYKIYRKVSEVRIKAEEAKRRLNAEKTVDVLFDGTDWPYRKKAEKEGQQLKLSLTQQSFVPHVRSETQKRCQFIDRVVKNAGWEWAQITTLLFTGQGTRVPAIRETVLDYIKSKRSDAWPIPIVIEPDDTSGFDPKRCVALGAAVLGSSRDSAWIDVRNRMSGELTFDLQRERGPRLETIIRAGTPLPATATVAVNADKRQLDLWKNGVLFLQFKWTTPTTSVVVEARGPADFRILVNDQSHPGVLL